MKIKILVFVFFLAAVAVFYIRTPQKASVTIMNQSGKVLKIVTIELCGESASAENLPAQAAKNLELKVHSDCHYQVDATFESGEKLSNGIGYVTNGLSVEDQIIVTDSEIKIA